MGGPPCPRPQNRSGLLALHVCRRHGHPLCGCNHRDGQKQSAERRRQTGRLGQGVEDDRLWGEDASPRPIPVGPRHGGPLQQGGRSCGDGSRDAQPIPKTTYTIIAIAEKQFKRSKKGPFSLYIVSPGSHPGNEINGARWGRSLPVPLPPVSPAMVRRLLRRRDVRQTQTRQDNHLDLPTIKSESGRRRFFYRTADMYNRLPSRIAVSRIGAFKRRLRSHLTGAESSGGASPSAVVRQTISDYKFIAMCQQRQQRRPLHLRAGAARRLRQLHSGYV